MKRARSALEGQRFGSLKLLQQLQLGLEAVYRLDPAPDIVDFVVLAEAATPEQLRILEEEDLFLELALDPAVLTKLQGARHLGPHNLAEFCLLVEGISHFLLVIFSARQDRSLSALELELQAELDKYVVGTVMANRLPTLSDQQLRTQLYERFRLRQGLELGEQRRYRWANLLARRYASQLNRCFVREQRIGSMLTELRQFYRMAYARKHEHIDRRCA